MSLLQTNANPGIAPDMTEVEIPPSKLSADGVIETDIPLRLDSLLWSGFHTRVVTALGITWILDGLEVTLAGALSGAVKESPTAAIHQFRRRYR